ncbi:hypothetical protein K466DRAFT_285002 [Polyporus arcularius HHB13444]|uniref:Uncharacterized protein n=1 Tax=Polyporus arcularius HHB13444 TaxID=1314778 RepID=A0A5C3PAI5_9APHY|nr:hypothetical protein K466DRAFT_285002 [Polyporus arcularius HHB13444]
MPYLRAPPAVRSPTVVHVHVWSTDAAGSQCQQPDGQPSTACLHGVQLRLTCWQRPSATWLGLQLGADRMWTERRSLTNVRGDLGPRACGKHSESVGASVHHSSPAAINHRQVQVQYVTRLASSPLVSIRRSRMRTLDFA